MSGPGPELGFAAFAAFAGSVLGLRFPGPPQILADRGTRQMRIDRFVTLALQSRDDVRKIVAFPRAGELESTLDGGSAGR